MSACFAYMYVYAAWKLGEGVRFPGSRVTGLVSHQWMLGIKSPFPGRVASTIKPGAIDPAPLLYLWLCLIQTPYRNGFLFRIHLCWSVSEFFSF